MGRRRQRSFHARAVNRLLMLVPSLSPTDGGPSEAVKQLVPALTALDTHVTVLATDSGVQGRGSEIRPLGLDTTTSLVVLDRIRPPYSFSFSPRQALSLLRHARNVQLVHVHGYYTWQALLAGLLLPGMRVPYVVQPHGALEPYHQGVSRRRKRTYERTLGKLIAWRASGWLFTSDDERANATELLGLAEDMTYVVPLGAHLEPATAYDEASWWRADFAVAAPTVAFLGRLTAKKGLDRLLEAWPLLRSAAPEARLIIAGPPSDPSVLRLVRDAVRQDASVHYVGMVADADKATLLQFADCFVLPSRSESFGISVAESLIAGTPVVITSEVPLARIVERCRAGIVLKHLTPPLLAAALNEVLVGDAWQQSAREAAAVLGSRFSWESAARDYLAAYQAVTHGTSRRH